MMLPLACFLHALSRAFPATTPQRPVLVHPDRIQHTDRLPKMGRDSSDSTVRDATVDNPFGHTEELTKKFGFLSMLGVGFVITG